MPYSFFQSCHLQRLDRKTFLWYVDLSIFGHKLTALYRTHWGARLINEQPVTGGYLRALHDLYKKGKHNYEWPVWLFNNLFSTAHRRVPGWLLSVFFFFEVIRRKAGTAYCDAEPVICLEDPRIAPKTVRHCTRSVVKNIWKTVVGYSKSSCFLMDLKGLRPNTWYRYSDSWLKNNNKSSVRLQFDQILFVSLQTCFWQKFFVVD